MLDLLSWQIYIPTPWLWYRDYIHAIIVPLIEQPSTEKYIKINLLEKAVRLSVCPHLMSHAFLYNHPTH